MAQAYQLDIYIEGGLLSKQKSERMQVCFVTLIGLPQAETTTENCCGVEGRRLRKQTQTILALYVEAIVVRKKKFDMLLQMVDML